MQLTVGEVSGLIAVAIALLQFLVPNALTVILVALLSQEQNAVTWSAVSRSLSNSIWPVLLRSDSASSRGVPTKINLVTWCRPLALAMIAIAAIITPIGLYEDLLPSEEPHLVTFQAVVDTGTLGSGTQPRSDLGFSRNCGYLARLQCPGTTVVIEVSSDANWTNSTVEGDQPYDRRVPKVLASLYQSGLRDQPSSVSSFFDIQARQYQFGSEQGTFTNETYLLDSFKPMGSMIMDDSISLVDGLIVDMSKGRIGFRKHTIPTGLVYGAEWNEDILFLEPETVCVDTNLTYEVQIPVTDNVYNPAASSAYLVDKGGWVNMNITNPLTGPWFEDMQTSLLDNGDPSLQVRAYQAGWWNNVQNMYYFNISKPFTNRTAYLHSKLGERYPVNTSSYGLSSKDELLFGKFGYLFDGIPTTDYMPNGSFYLSADNYTGPYWSNPWNISSTNYSDIALTCAGAYGGDKANMTNIDIKCGLLLGPSSRVDGTTSNVYAPGSWWSRPIYSCASASKATIKTVHFNYNASRSGGLGSLNVTLIADKVYQDKSEMPLWGVEKPNMNLSSITPFWGLIDPSLENSVNLSTIRAEKIYIPASTVTWFTFGLAAKGTFNYLPATEGSPQIWSTIYGATTDTNINLGFDYTGSTNLALHQKWQKILTNGTGAAQIINLMYTDYAANYFTSTRSWLTPRDSLPPNLGETKTKRAVADAASNGQVPVQVYQRKIRYHFVYGIPAAICLVITALICTAALASIVFRQVSLGRIRYYIYSLSAGRLLGAFLFPTEGDPRADTKTWIDQVGRKPVRLPDPDAAGGGRFEKSHVRSYSLVDQKDSTKVATTTALDIDEGDSGTSHRSAA
ncbi:hypothetical protein H2200_003885 [Cladophialophora chaetospira]|uniref:Uncharacterized protein n=1 Tax=Cladophialophora chaetospira TaxID=386627 RepID=A0AA39CLJ0_9EURO|nr:hypothetical protein H2200_003885 [Cladophialophora chaetospira]